MHAAAAAHLALPHPPTSRLVDCQVSPTFLKSTAVSTLLAAYPLQRSSLRLASLPSLHTPSFNCSVVTMATTLTSSSVPSAFASLSSTSKLILACFAADSLSLSSHWEYDPGVIRARLGRVDRLLPPSLTRYHAGKQAGDLTHFGDTALMTLESIQQCHGTFEQQHYTRLFYQRWLTHSGYRDQATRHTLDNLARGLPAGYAGSAVDDDVGHAARVFTLLACHMDEQHIATAARDMCAVTQALPQCHRTAELLARWAHRLMHPRNSSSKPLPTRVLTAVLSDMGDEWLTRRCDAGLQSVDLDDIQAVAYGFGSACYIRCSLPSIVHFVAKYEKAADPIVALVEDNAVGGNTAARNMVIALVLYAYKGTDFGSLWTLIDGLRQKDRMVQLLADIEQSTKPKKAVTQVIL